MSDRKDVRHVKNLATVNQKVHLQESFRGPGLIWSKLRENKLVKQKLKAVVVVSSVDQLPSLTAKGIGIKAPQGWDVYI